MHRSSPFRTHHRIGHAMCVACTEAVLFRSTLSSQVWTCVKYAPKQSIPFRRAFSLFPQPLHAFMAQRRFFVYISAGPCLQIRQPFHDSMFGTRQIRRPLSLQGRRISRVPKRTIFKYLQLWASMPTPMPPLKKQGSYESTIFYTG